jgi:hypothetical protein
MLPDATRRPSSTSHRLHRELTHEFDDPSSTPRPKNGFSGHPIINAINHPSWIDEHRYTRDVRVLRETFTEYSRASHVVRRARLGYQAKQPANGTDTSTINGVGLEQYSITSSNASANTVSGHEQLRGHQSNIQSDIDTIDKTVNSIGNNPNSLAKPTRGGGGFQAQQVPCPGNALGNATRCRETLFFPPPPNIAFRQFSNSSRTDIHLNEQSQNTNRGNNSASSGNTRLPYTHNGKIVDHSTIDRLVLEHCPSTNHRTHRETP